MLEVAWACRHATVVHTYLARCPLALRVPTWGLSSPSSRGRCMTGQDQVSLQGCMTVETQVRGAARTGSAMPTCFNGLRSSPSSLRRLPPNVHAGYVYITGMAPHLTIFAAVLRPRCRGCAAGELGGAPRRGGYASGQLKRCSAGCSAVCTTACRSGYIRCARLTSTP